MLKIWGRNTSANVQKATWALGELGIKFERIDVGGPFGKNNEAPYLAMNPNGVVPTLEEDDGFILWESNSIVRYLGAKYGAGTLEPSDLKTRFAAQRWMDWNLSTTNAAIFPVFWGLIRTPPEKRDPKAIEDGKTKCVAALKIMEEQLARTRFIAGDDFSYGDIAIGPFAYRYFRLVPDHPPLPNVERWYAELCARPAFKEHVLDVPFV
ncbi:MAG TPA: glutathione S-transferase family protein, partial [Xanthobacteraceae bacterium]|nr:glutathione S-transferase family protein [Xanthobacteraceae bacterium]